VSPEAKIIGEVEVGNHMLCRPSASRNARMQVTLSFTSEAVSWNGYERDECEADRIVRHYSHSLSCC
jgi:hypothetical protein